MTERPPIQDNYILSRGFSANTRINLQHYLWKDGSSNIVHPSIPLDKQGIRVADIGSGTCIWLIELARQLDASAELDGLDISHDQAPPKENLPANVNLRIHDCLTDPPSELHGRYDLIHIQNFNTIIRDNNPVPVINHMLTMLKPGGYLTWGEYNYQTWKINKLASATDYDNQLEKLYQHIATFGHTREPNSLIHNWTEKLPETFAECGMVGVATERRPFSPEITTFLLDTFMVASWEISLNVLDALGEGRGEATRKYIDGVGKHRKNITVNLERLTVVGQKPDF